ncbi:MarR family winged helix-turn-helix transcriptional regulator [Streptacidiphilus sp. PB12-B1b]|uniref:MarR family winged helix-turn-helix transcriptional regulator n=1 Tax=Streptacidiphilus sp. PB12-B1b TaxID=2705012 RepID=UPI002729735F|nr:MarR family transcriptional regulator [Streptacidiphilus sp. PB12-B1b]
MDTQSLSRTVSALRRALRTSLRSHGTREQLTGAQLEVLQTLDEAGHACIRELAERLRLAPNTVSQILSRLLETDLVERERDPHDRRVVGLGLTPLGLREVEAWKQAHERSLEGAVALLSPGERGSLARALPGLDALVKQLRPASAAATARSWTTRMNRMAAPSPRADPMRPADDREPALDTRLLTEAVTGLRRALRASIRTDYPWETLPIAQVEVMQSLAESEPAGAGELATRLRLAPNTVSGLISRLMTAGLVDRGTNSGDRRKAVVQLTGTGRERLAAWQAAHENRIGAALDAIAPEDRAALSAALPAMGALVHHLYDELGERPDENTAAPAQPPA